MASGWGQFGWGEMGAPARQPEGLEGSHAVADQVLVLLDEVVTSSVAAVI